MPRKKDTQETVLTYFETADLSAAQATLGFVQHILKRRASSPTAPPIDVVAAAPPVKPRRRRGPNKKKAGISPTPPVNEATPLIPALT